MEAAWRLSAEALWRRGGCVALNAAALGRRYCGVEAAWGRSGGGMEAAWGRRYGGGSMGQALRRRYEGVEAALLLCGAEWECGLRGAAPER